VGNNFASKQLEKQTLTTACGSPVRISIKNLETCWKDSMVEACSSSSQSPAVEPEGLCLEVKEHISNNYQSRCKLLCQFLSRFTACLLM